MQKFQFLHGAIKSLSSWNAQPLESNFNSFMVRLKETLPFFLRDNTYRFQFLHGAIKSKAG